MIADNYIKSILTLIAIGIIGINFYLFKINLIEQAYAAPSINNVVAVDGSERYVYLISSDGKYACKVHNEHFRQDKWTRTGCWLNDQSN